MIGPVKTHPHYDKESPEENIFVPKHHLDVKKSVLEFRSPIRDEGSSRGLRLSSPCIGLAKDRVKYLESEEAEQQCNSLLAQVHKLQGLVSLLELNDNQFEVVKMYRNDTLKKFNYPSWVNDCLDALEEFEEAEGGLALEDDEEEGATSKESDEDATNDSSEVSWSSSDAPNLSSKPVATLGSKPAHTPSPPLTLPPSSAPSSSHAPASDSAPTPSTTPTPGPALTLGPAHILGFVPLLSAAH
ncbi:uncharacterized protein A4U43_C08F18400 [Asparagus officinalis]|nr:uncharacterized protein A4U43_C08F18400 [Asparagus officinalis]